MKLKVSNLKNKNNKAMVNQFVIALDNKIIFQSYEDTIVTLENEECIISNNYNISPTTEKATKIFLLQYYKEEEVKKLLKKALTNKQGYANI